MRQLTVCRTAQLRYGHHAARKQPRPLSRLSPLLLPDCLPVLSSDCFHRQGANLEEERENEHHLPHSTTFLLTAHSILPRSPVVIFHCLFPIPHFFRSTSSVLPTTCSRSFSPLPAAAAQSLSSAAQPFRTLKGSHRASIESPAKQQVPYPACLPACPSSCPLPDGIFLRLFSV